MAVYDIFNRRLSIVSPEFRTVRMVPAGFLLGSVLVIDPKRFLTAGFIRTPDNIGYALHVVKIDPNDGLHIERSFGGRGVAPSPATGAWEFNWDIKPSMNGRFWTAERLAYRIQLWDQNGVPQLMLERQPKWFRPQTRVWLGNANTPPNPVGAGVSEEGGVLWTFTHVPDSNWRRAWPEIPTAEIESKGPDVAEVVDTMVEAIDIASWRVIARARMPERVVNVLPGGRVVTFQHDANGETQLKIHTLRIER